MIKSIVPTFLAIDRANTRNMIIQIKLSLKNISNLCLIVREKVWLKNFTLLFVVSLIDLYEPELSFDH